MPLLMWKGAVQQSARPPAPPQLPVNTSPPYITGDTVQGGTLVFNPGTWLYAISFDYRVLRGDGDGPAVPDDVLMDWTNDTSVLVEGINDGDYLWLQERATNENGATIAAATDGFGPMEALEPAVAVVIGTGGVSTNAATAASTYTFDMDISDVPARGLIVQLQCQGSNSSAQLPSWDNVSIEGVPLTRISSASIVDGTAPNDRHLVTETWVLWGNSVPTGSGLTISATRSTSSGAMGSTLSAIAIGNTQAAAPVTADTAFYSSLTDASAYTFNDTAANDDTLAIVFAMGQFISTGGSPVFDAPTWDVDIPLWPGARATAQVMWGATVSKVLALAGEYEIAYTITDTGAQRYGAVATVKIAGSNM